MDILDIFCERITVSFAIGFMNFKDLSDGEIIRIPCCSINIGENHEPISDKLALNSRLILRAYPTENGLFAYTINGDHMEGGAIINERTGEKVAEEIYFSFSATIQIRRDGHEIFQKLLAKTSFWILMIESASKTLVAVDSSTEKIISIHEAPLSLPEKTYIH